MKPPIHLFQLGLLVFMLTTNYCLVSTECIPPSCYNIRESTNSQDFEVRNSSWTIFCFDGKVKQVYLLWSNPVLKVSTQNGSSESFQFIFGESPEQVEEKKESSLQLPQVLQNLKFMFNLDFKENPFSPFNRSCIGIHSNQKYIATFKYKRIELWYVAYLALGVVTFLYAKQLSQNVKLQYGTGVSLGIVASLLILMIILHRVFPQSLKKIGYLMVLSSCCASMYFWQLFATSFSTTIFSYWKWILGYIALMGFISFGVCYKYGPITEKKNLNILQWMIQAIGLLLIFQGTQFPEVSAAIIIVILTLYNLPAGLYNNSFTRYFRFKLFRPKIRLLTEEEYQRQGYEETKKALEDLRQFCQSPECKPWKVISKLKSPERFASFVEGDSWHVNDQELLEYDSVLNADMPSETEEEDSEENLISEDEIMN